MKLKTKLGTAALALSISLATSAFAQDKDTAIRNAETAYNVALLEKANTIRLVHEFKIEFPGHDYGPEFSQYSHQTHMHVLDLKNDRASSDYLTYIGNSNYHARTIFEDGNAISIDYPNNNYQDNGETDFISEYARLVRSSDVLLALWLSRSADAARYLREENWLGLPHDVVEIDFPQSPPLQIYVRRKDGAITKMDRVISEDLTVYYTFDRHKKQDGSLIAQEYSFYAEGERGQFSYNRSIDINNRKDRKAFYLEKDIVEEPERVDETELSVNQIGINADPGRLLTHHVGLGENFTTFMKTGDYVTAYGTRVGFTERLKAYRDETKVTLPIRYAIVPDHHEEQTAGAAEAVAAGATLLTTPDGATALAGILEGKGKVEVVDSVRSISGLEIYPMSTDHARQVLAAYFEPQKVALQSSHYASPYADAGFYAKFTAVTLYNAYPQEVKDDALVLITSESKKPETWQGFKSAVQNHSSIRCHRNRPICEHS